MINFSTKAIATAAAAVTLVGGGVTTALVYESAASQNAPATASRAADSQQSAVTGAGSQQSAVDQAAGSQQQSDAQVKAASGKDDLQDLGTKGGDKDATKAAADKKADTAKADTKKAAMPTGVSTATSFWDAETASGKPMAYHTIASPYWPLGTKVKIIYNGKSDIGVVEDFGPAEWAVAQHSPPAIVDLSEEMMQHLTGVRSNSVPVKFQVLQWGDGGVYRHSGTGYSLAMTPVQVPGKA